MLQTLRSQIIIMVAIPILGLIITSWFSISDKNEASQQYEVLLPLAQVSTVASDLIHELQKERGKTVGLITNSFADRNRQIVAEQRQLTNPRITNFQKVVADTNIKTLAPDLTPFFDRLDQRLAQVSDHRANVDNNDMVVPKNVGFYTGIIHDLIAIISQSVSSSPSDELTAKLLPYLALVEAKEASGLERAIGSALFNNAAQGKFALKQFLTYYSKFAGEQAFLAQFNDFASADYKALFEGKVQGPDVDQVIEWRKILHTLPVSRDGQGVDGTEWFQTATSRINKIYDVEKTIGQDSIALASDLYAQVNTERTTLIIIDILILGVAGVIAAYVAIRIARGLGSVTGDIRTLAGGNHNFEVQSQERTDEFGEIARALEKFRQNEEERITLEKKAQEAQFEAEQKRSQMLDRIVTEFKETVGRSLRLLTEQSNALEQVSQNLSKKSEEGGSRSLSVAENSMEASSQVENVAQSGQEMADSITEVAQNVSHTTASMQSIVHEVDMAANRISSLQTASQAIGSVVQMITDIAGQTNLLALNATIEAARAGEAGKGFAVVASEVKTLSQQTEKATAQISNEIKAIQEETANAVESIRTVEESIKAADGVIAAIASAVEEQSATTNQMSHNMKHIVNKTTSVTDDISYVCQSSAASSGAGIQVLWSVTDLKAVQDEIEQGSQRFLEALNESS